MTYSHNIISIHVGLVAGSKLKHILYSLDTRQENDEPEDSTIEEDSHNDHVSLLKRELIFYI